MDKLKYVLYIKYKFQTVFHTTLLYIVRKKKIWKGAGNFPPILFSLSLQTFPLKELFTQKWNFAENVFTLRPSKM